MINAVANGADAFGKCEARNVAGAFYKVLIFIEFETIDTFRKNHLYQLGIISRRKVGNVVEMVFVTVAVDDFFQVVTVAKSEVVNANVIRRKLHFGDVDIARKTPTAKPTYSARNQDLTFANCAV